MTRTHLIATGSMAQQLTAIASATSTTVPTQTVQSLTPWIVGSDFDFLAAIESINTHYLRNEVLKSLLWTLEGNIKFSISRLLNSFWAISKREGSPVTFEDYDHCIRFCESINFNTDSIEAMGLSCTNPRQQIQAEVDLFLTLHAMRYQHVDLKDPVTGETVEYIPPAIVELLGQIKPKKVSKKTAAKKLLAAMEDADGDKEEEAIIYKVMIGKSQKKLDDNVEFAKNSVKAIINMYNCLGIVEDVQGENSFDDLDLKAQFGLIQALSRSISTGLEFAADHWSVDENEYAAMRAETKELRKSLPLFMRHRKFASIEM